MCGRGVSLVAWGVVSIGVIGACFAGDLPVDQEKSVGKCKLEIVGSRPDIEKGQKGSPRAAVLRAVDTRVRGEFVEAPLSALPEAIGKQFHIPVVLDRRALSDEGLDSDTPVSCSMNGVRLRSFLERILSDLDLAWTIRHQAMLITTATADQENLETRVYDVSDLVSVPEFDETDFDTLIELITCVISPADWDSVGGVGSIIPFEGRGLQAIAVSQTLSVHEQIEKLLADLRTYIPTKEGKKGKPADTTPVTKQPTGKVVVGEEAIRRALQKKVELDFTEMPLEKVIEHLKELLQIEIYLHCRSLCDEGLDIDTPISFKLSGISAASALSLMLSDFDLSYIIKDNYLLILTTTQQMEELDFKVYDVADLAADDATYCDLIDMITSTISPESWCEIGGEGSIASFCNAGMKVLVVSQTQYVHDDIEKLLGNLRKVRRKVGDDEEKIVSIRRGSRKSFGDIGGWGQRCIRQRQYQRTPIPVKADYRRDILVQGNNRFAFDLYAKLREANESENLFFSPLSISTAMSMVQAGARGDTAEEISRAMHFDLPQSRLHSACRSLTNILQDGSTCELNIANRLWVQSGYDLLETYKKITRDYYGAECGTVAFVGKRNVAVAEINNWVERYTKNRIRNLVTPSVIREDTSLVLTNAVYFNGQWADPFKAHHTKSAPFFADDGKKQVKMMSMMDTGCSYAEIEEAGLQILEKPYDPLQGMSMVILLPKREPGSLARLEASLTEEKLAAWTQKLVGHPMISVLLPKFRLEMGYSLKKQLIGLGMGSAFGEGPHGPDFSGIDGSRNLYLQFVVHKAFVDVNEQGTEAAAATAGGMGGGLIGSLPPEFWADHPFVFIIRDKRTGSILFLGRFVTPG